MFGLKIEEKKYKIYFIALGIFCLGGVIFSLFFFKGRIESGLPAGLRQSDSVKIKRIDIKQINTEIFTDEKFKKLKENKVKQPSISELDIGKDDPFQPD
jgi:hypothetical protein